jgi:hypothetical protein
MKKKNVGRPKRNADKTVKCFVLNKIGVKQEMLAFLYDWKTQENDYGAIKCSTARRHIRDGKRELQRRSLIRKKAFGR